MTRQLFLAALLAAASASPALAQCTTSWTNPAGGAWTDGANWDNGVPGNTDDACIILDGTYTVTVSGFTINSLTVGDPSNVGTQTLQNTTNNFSVVDPSTIQASGRLDWRNGYLTSGTLTNLGLVQLTSGGGSRGVNGTTVVFRNEGTVEHTDITNFYVFGTGARVENAALWDIQTDADLSGFSGGGSTYVNEATGTLRKSAGSGLTTITGSPLVIENAGTVDVQSGELRFDRSSTHTSATFTTAAGATLQFSTGGVTFIGAQTGAQAGTFQNNTAITAGAGASWDFSGTGMRWANGYLTTGTLTNLGLVRIDGGGGSRGVSTGSGSATFRNEGTVEHVDNQPFYIFGNDGRFENASLYDLQADGDIRGFSGTMSVFVNEAGATFQKSGGPGLSDVSGAPLSFENAGTVDVQSGELRFDRPSTHTSANFTTAASTTIRFNAGGVTFIGPQTGAQAGTLQTDDAITAGAGAEWAFSGTGLLWQEGYFVSGTLTNTGLVRIDGSGGSRGVNSGSGSATFRNEGTVEHADNQPFYVVGDDARVENAALWDVQAEGDLRAFTGTMSVFVNEATATFQKSAGTGISDVSGAPLSFENAGTVDVQSGELRFDRPSTHTSATFTTAAGATIRFNAGGVTFIGTNAGVQAGTLQLDDEPIPGANAVLAFTGTGLLWQDGYLTTGTLTNTGLVRIDGSGGNRGVNSGAGSATFRNEGTVEHVDNQPFYVYGDDARAENAALWDVQAEGDLRGFSGAMSVFVNEAGATFQKSGGVGISDIQSAPLAFENAGTVAVLTGEIDVNTTFDHQAGGVISGSGTFDMSSAVLLFTFDGDVSPGTSPGVLTWQNDFAPSSGSTLQIELAGTAGPGDPAGHDQLAAAGAATLDGTLEIDVTAGLSIGDTFTILTASSVTGTFTDVVGAGLPGYVFDVTYNAADVVVEVTDIVGPMTLTGFQGWRTLTTPYVNLPLGGRPDRPGLLQPIYTAGYLHADLDQRNRRGLANVFFYDEPSGAFVVPDDDGPIPSGSGIWVYVHKDDDPRTPGQQGGFPKQLTASCVGCVAETFPFTFPISYTPGAPLSGINLVGNPAEYDLDWDDPNWTRTNVSDVLYIWDPIYNGGDYRTWNGTTGSLPREGLIPVGQGFHVEATGPSPELIAPLSAKLPTQSRVYRLTYDDETPTAVNKTESVPQVRLSLRADLDGSERETEAFVTFEETAALGFDSRDARRLAGRPGADALRLYSVLGVAHGEEAGSAFQTATLPRELLEGEAPVEVEIGAEALLAGAAADQGATMIWEANGLPEGWAAVLRDRQTGATYSPGEVSLHLAAEEALTVTEADLAVSDAAYEVLLAEAVAGGLEPPAPPRPEARALKAQGAAPRFLLILTPQTADPTPVSTEIGLPVPNPAGSSARLGVRLDEETALRVVVYDVLGREVATAHDGVLGAGVHDVTVPVARLAPGAYVIRVAGGTWAETRRLTVAR